jgi:hypothetical protein
VNKHISCQPRAIATITGYRQLCAELEIENQALKAQNLELRAKLCGRIAPAFEPLDDPEAIAPSIGRTTAATKISAFAQ